MTPTSIPDKATEGKFEVFETEENYQTNY